MDHELFKTIKNIGVEIDDRFVGEKTRISPTLINASSMKTHLIDLDWVQLSYPIFTRSLEAYGE